MIDLSKLKQGAVKDKFKLKHLLRPRLDVHLKFNKPLQSVPVNVLGISKMFPVKDQGTSGSCGGQAWSEYLQGLKYLRDGNVVELSAKDIYQNVYLPGGGSQESDLINQVEQNGVAYESDISSYQNGNPPDENYMEKVIYRVGEVIDRAMQQIVFSPKTFNGNDINQVKQAIDFGNGAVVALLGNNACWQTSNGVVEVPALNQLEWGHWLRLVKYDDTTKLITVKNSWGIEAGDQGYYYIPYEYFSGGRVYGEWTMMLQPQGYYVGLLQQLINLYKNLIQLLTKK